MPPSLLPFPPAEAPGTKIPTSSGPRGRRIFFAHGALALAYGTLSIGRESVVLWVFVCHLFAAIVLAVISAARDDGDGLYGHARGIGLAAVVAFVCFSVACSSSMAL
jgi:hypothetical protein